MNKKNQIFQLLQQVFIWPEEKIWQLTLKIKELDSSRENDLDNVIKQLEGVLEFQKKTLEKAREVNPNFYPELSKKIKILYKKEADRISKEERKLANAYLEKNE